MPEREQAFYQYFWFMQEINERNYEAALRRLETMSEVFQEEARYKPKTLLRAEIFSFMNKDALASEEFHKACVFLEEQVKKQPDYAAVHSSLGLAYAGLNRKEDAIRAGKKAMELVPSTIDKFMGWAYIVEMAEIYTMLGEYDLAFIELERALTIPAWFSVKFLLLQPSWDPLREQPRYKQIVEKYSKS
jgi:tetratricopeptide (TPR) repeat protein